MATAETEPFGLASTAEKRDLSPFEQEVLLNDMEQYAQGLMENLREKNEAYAELLQGDTSSPKVIKQWESDIQELADEITALQTEILGAREENPVMTIQNAPKK